MVEPQEDPREEPLEVQIALQGGGAKLYSLLIAMREVERLEGRSNERRQHPAIKVTHIAGTSAGAIVAALYAARVPMGKVLARIEQLSLNDLLPPNRLKGFLGFARVKASVLNWFAKTVLRLSREKRSFLQSHGINLGNVLMGYSAYKTDQLKEQLRWMFNNFTEIRDGDHSDASSPKWGDFKDVTFERFGSDGSIKLSAVRTELRTRRPYSARHNENLLDFLVDSAALPFLLRNVRDENWDLLDGGICANLPSQFLNGTRRVAIGFSPSSSGTRLSAAESRWVKVTDLLDAAIDYSVERSMDQIGKENCCQLPSTLSTYDFRSVVGAESKPLREAEARSVETNVRGFFAKFVALARAERKLKGDIWKLATKSDATSQALRRALENLSSLTPSKFPIMKYSQEFLLDVDLQDPRSTFKAWLEEEREIDTTEDLGPTSEWSPVRYLKASLLFPDDVVIADYSCIGQVGRERRELRPIECISSHTKGDKHPVDDLQRTVLFDLKKLLELKRALDRGAESQIRAIQVRSTLSAVGLIKYICNAEYGGEEFLLDLGVVGKDAVDVFIKVHMPDKYVASCKCEKVGNTISEVRRQVSGELSANGQIPIRNGFGCLSFEARAIDVRSLGDDKRVGFNLLVNA
jgi:predicted acylesterase/phospholipase RssA